MIGLLEAVHQVVPKGTSLVIIHRGSIVPTVEVVGYSAILVDDYYHADAFYIKCMLY